MAPQEILLRTVAIGVGESLLSASESAIASQIQVGSILMEHRPLMLAVVGPMPALTLCRIPGSMFHIGA